MSENQPRDAHGRFDGYAASESGASLGGRAGTLDLNSATFSNESMRIYMMDQGSDPRSYLSDKDSLVRISAAGRLGVNVSEKDRPVAETLAA